MINLFNRIKIYIISILAIVFLCMWVLEKNKNKDIKVDTVASTTSTNIEAVSNGSISKKESESISKKIEATKPVYVVKSNSKLNDNTIASTVKNNDATKTATNIIKEEQDSHTTNVYAIDNSKKNRHGVGVYIGKGELNRELEYGVSLRSNRFIVMLSSTNHSKHRFSVGYEVAQW